MTHGLPFNEATGRLRTGSVIWGCTRSGERAGSGGWDPLGVVVKMADLAQSMSDEVAVYSPRRGLMDFSSFLANEWEEAETREKDLVLAFDEAQDVASTSAVNTAISQAKPTASDAIGRAVSKTLQTQGRAATPAVGLENVMSSLGIGGRRGPVRPATFQCPDCDGPFHTGPCPRP